MLSSCGVTVPDGKGDRDSSVFTILSSLKTYVFILIFHKNRLYFNPFPFLIQYVAHRDHYQF